MLRHNDAGSLSVTMLRTGESKLWKTRIGRCPERSPFSILGRFGVSICSTNRVCRRTASERSATLRLSSKRRRNEVPPVFGIWKWRSEGQKGNSGCLDICARAVPLKCEPASKLDVTNGRQFIRRPQQIPHEQQSRNDPLRSGKNTAPASLIK